MYTQNKKIFYIIGSNPINFFDMTVEGLEVLQKSEVVLLSKSFHKNFIIFLKENKKKFFFKEDLSINSGINLWKKILELFKKNNSLAYLVSGDPYFCYKDELEEFLKEKKIVVNKIIGILEIASWVNKKNDFLTNREKNSSILFHIPTSLTEIKKILNENFSGKLVIIIKEKNLLNKFLKQFNKKSKIKYQLYINGHRQGRKKMSFNIESPFSNAYVILCRE